MCIRRKPITKKAMHKQTEGGVFVRNPSLETVLKSMPWPFIARSCSSTMHLQSMQDQRSEIFLLAEREISHLLADNLLLKFKASAPYKELVQDEKLQES